MGIFKKGDIVARKSYNKDILFTVERIINLKNNKGYAILKGVTIRIEADAEIDDLVKISKDKVEDSVRSLNNKIEQHIKFCNTKVNYGINKHEGETRGIKEYTGIILHLDGDAPYSNPTKNLHISTIFKHTKTLNHMKKECIV